MPNPVQRSACDRCHGQKLRCARSGHAGPCIRCTKVKAICTWTPSARRQSQKQLNICISPTGSDENGIETPFHAPHTVVQPQFDFAAFSMLDNPTTPAWPGSTLVDFISGSSSASPTADTCVQQSGESTWQYRSNQEWAMLSAQQQSPPEDRIVPSCLDSRVNPQETQRLQLLAIRGLSDLNVDMFSLSSTIPKPPTCISQPHSWKNKDFAIDKTFQLSQRLIEVLNQLFPHNSESHNYVMTPPNEAEAVLAPTNYPLFDQSSFLLVLSCYQRLIETYHNIFGNMQACLDRSMVTACEDYVQMPDMKVGSFSVPHSSALQITVVLQLSRHLLCRMGVIIKSLNTSCNGDGVNDLMSFTFKAVKEREDELVKTISKLGNSLLSLDIL